MVDVTKNKMSKNLHKNKDIVAKKEEHLTTLRLGRPSSPITNDYD
jgi:hypothetical protein